MPNVSVIAGLPTQRGVTPLGLDDTVTFSEQELDALVDNLKAIESAVGWLWGDIYRAKTVLLKLIPGQHTHLASSHDAVRGLASWCELRGLDRRTIENHASICNVYPLKDRVEGLTISHHTEVASLNPKQREDLLTKAKEHGWSTRKLREERKILQGTAIPSPSRIINPPKNVEDEMVSLKLELTKNKKFKSSEANKIVTAVKKEQKKLHTEFDKAVFEAANKLVDIKVKQERDRLSAFSQELQKQEKLLKMRGKQVHGMMSKIEYKKIISCLHPDKQPEDKRKAYEAATQIFLRLKDTVQPDAIWRA